MKDIYSIIQEVCGKFQGILREICFESVLEDIGEYDYVEYEDGE